MVFEDEVKNKAKKLKKQVVHFVETRNWCPKCGRSILVNSGRGLTCSSCGYIKGYKGRQNKRHKKYRF